MPEWVRSVLFVAGIGLLAWLFVRDVEFEHRLTSLEVGMVHIMKDKQ